MLRLHRGIFHQDTIAVFRFLQDVLPEAVRDQRDLQITRITVIGHRGVIHHIIRIERLGIPFRIQRQIKIPAAIWHRIQLRILSFALYCFPAHLRQLLLDPAKLLGNRVLRHALHLCDLFLRIAFGVIQTVHILILSFCASRLYPSTCIAVDTRV